MTTSTPVSTTPPHGRITPAGRFPLGALLLLSTAVFVTVTAESLPAGLLPEMVAGLDTDPLGVGLLISVWAVTVIATSLPLARLTARIDRRLVVGVALAGFAVANLATALAPTYEAAVASRVAAAVAHGLFWAIVIVYASSMLVDSHLGRGLAIVTAGGTTATLAGLPAGALIAQLLDWRWAFGLLAAVAAVLAVVIMVALPASRPRPTVKDAATASLRHDPSLVPIGLFAGAALVFALGQFASFTYVRPFLEMAAGVPAEQVPLVLFGYGIAGLIGAAAAGVLADRWPRGSLVVVLAAEAIAFGVLGVAATLPAAMLAALAVWGFGVGAFFPLQQSLLMRVATDRTRTLASAGIVVVFNIGIAVGPWLGDAVGGADQPTATMALSAGAIAAAAAFAVAGLVVTRRQSTSR